MFHEVHECRIDAELFHDVPPDAGESLETQVYPGNKKTGARTPVLSEFGVKHLRLVNAGFRLDISNVV